MIAQVCLGAAWHPDPRPRDGKCTASVRSQLFILCARAQLQGSTLWYVWAQFLVRRRRNFRDWHHGMPVRCAWHVSCHVLWTTPWIENLQVRLFELGAVWDLIIPWVIHVQSHVCARVGHGLLYCRMFCQNLLALSISFAKGPPIISSGLVAVVYANPGMTSTACGQFN